MLVDSEEDLGDPCFGVNFQFLFYVIGLPHQSHGACSGVFNHVWFGGDCQLKAQSHLVGFLFLFFDFGVHVKKQFFRPGVDAASFSL